MFNGTVPATSPEAVSGLRLCRQGRREASIEIVEGADPKGRPYLWIGDFMSDSTAMPKSDLAAIEAGAVAVTPLHFDMTHRNSLKTLREVFAS